jgi:hypothetical protein
VQRKLRGSIGRSKRKVARQGTGIAVVKVLHDLTSTNVTVSKSAVRQDYIQHTNCMRGILLSSVTCLTLPNFFHYFINGTTFGEEVYGT